jgi:hypothetical protein
MGLTGAAPPRRSVVLLAVATATVLMTAIAGSAGAAPSQSAERPPSVFLAPNGSDANACTMRSAPCASFDRAYRAAKPGEVVEVRGGTYPPQRILAAPGKTGPNVLFRPAARARVVVDGISFGANGDPARGPAFITLRGMETTYHRVGLSSRNQRGIFVGPGSRRITLENMDAGSIDSWFAEGLSVHGGDYGPCNVLAFHVNVCGNNKQDASRNVLIDGATFHDMRMDESCFQNGADCHWECMYLNATTNMTVRNSKFFNCSLYNIFVTISGPEAAAIGHKNLVIENNWFATPWTESPNGGGQPRRPSAVALAWCVNSPSQGYRNVHVRFNSFSSNTGVETDRTSGCVWENVRFTGNLLQFQGCDARSIYSYNVWSRSFRAGRCSPTDKVGARTLPYRNETTDASLDFRLTTARRTLADNLVPRTVFGGCPRTDFHRQRRPLERHCDAGAHERVFPPAGKR